MANHPRLNMILRPTYAVRLLGILCVAVFCQLGFSDDQPEGVWRQRGFEDFITGRFGNAGQNLYVSRAGVLQRIHQHDFNKDGYFDLVFCNDHDHGESAPTYVYRDPMGPWPGR